MIKKYNECCIVIDLMPMYIDDLASDESILYIEKHIKSCDNCKNKLLQMKNKSMKNIKSCHIE